MDQSEGSIKSRRSSNPASIRENASHFVRIYFYLDLVELLFPDLTYVGILNFDVLVGSDRDFHGCAARD